MIGTDPRGYDSVRPIGWDGLNNNERRVLELWDRDVPASGIVELTGFTRAFVTDVLTEYSVTALDPWKPAAAVASAMLAAALRSHHPDRVGAGQ